MCCCSTLIDPLVLDKDDQQIAISFSLNNQTFNMSAIYASTSNLRKRELWSKLDSSKIQYNVPWCFIDDFNTNLGAHEHSGRFTHARPPMD